MTLSPNTHISFYWATVYFTTFVAPLWPRIAFMANALTDPTLKALKPAPAGKRYEKRDGLVPGLLVRVTETGKRTFMLPPLPRALRSPRGASLVCDALSLDKARQRARDRLELIRKGIDQPGGSSCGNRRILLLQWPRIICGFRLRPDPDKPRQRKAAEVSRAFRRCFSRCGTSGQLPRFLAMTC